MTNKNNFKFCGISNKHNNQVDIEINDHIIILHCYTDGYNGTNGGRFCAGGNSYTFPSDKEPTYENMIQFIIDNTWIGKDIEDIIDKKKYDKIMEEYKMINLDKDKYYKGYLETYDNNSTVKILYNFDTE